MDIRYVCIIFTRFLLGAITMQAAAPEVILSSYVLPENSIRAKLDSIFKTNNAINSLAHTRDQTWVDLKSWHWSVGTLTTDDQQSFVVKAPKFAAGTLISKGDIVFIHTPYQNISRINRAYDVQKIIEDKNLNRLRMPQSWVYAVSGNDGDLGRKDITDNDVIIVEELVSQKNNRHVWCPYTNGYVQEDVLKIDKETYQQLVTLAQEGRCLDLNPQNMLVDDKGNLVLIDLEDLFSHRRELVEKSNPLVKPLKKFKLCHTENGAILNDVARTGMANADQDIQKMWPRAYEAKSERIHV